MVKVYTKLVGRYRRDRYRHPMFIVRNNATGEHFIGKLAWTGGYSFEFDLTTEIRATATFDPAAILFFRAGHDAPAPQRVLIDLTRPEVAKWMEDTIARVVEENKLDFFRLDCNTHPGPG